MKRTSAVIMTLCLFFCIVSVAGCKPEQKTNDDFKVVYDQAMDLLIAGKNLEAAAMYRTISQYSDAAQKEQTCYQVVYDQAVALFKSGKFIEAAETFDRVKNFSDAGQQISKSYDSHIVRALQLAGQGNLPSAIKALELLAGKVDIESKKQELFKTFYDLAVQKSGKDDFAGAIADLELLKKFNFPNSQEMIKETAYTAGSKATATGNLYEAKQYFETYCKGYKDVDQILQKTEFLIIGRYWDMMVTAGLNTIDLTFILRDRIQTSTYIGSILDYLTYSSSLLRDGTKVYSERYPTAKTEELGPFKFENGSINYQSGSSWLLFAKIAKFETRNKDGGGQEYVLTLKDGFWGATKEFKASMD